MLMLLGGNIGILVLSLSIYIYYYYFGRRVFFGLESDEAFLVSYSHGIVELVSYVSHKIVESVSYTFD